MRIQTKHTPWLLAALVAAAPALADVKTVSVEGEAAIIDGDAAQTEKNAKRDARRKAVEQGIGVLVESNTIVRNFQLVADEIATTAKGVINDEQWGPLTDGDTKTTKKIKLTAKVSKEAIEGSICTVIKANHDPKVTLVFVEKVGDEAKWSTERGMIETMFTEAFRNACFTIVEPGIKVTELNANGDLTQEDIEKIVKNSNAQYVVLGQGKVIKGDNKFAITEGTKMNSYSVSANVKMINSATNEIEATAFRSTNILGISPENALKAVETGGGKGRMIVDAVMDGLMKKVAERWSEVLTNEGRVQVIVKEVPSFGAAKSFKEMVQRVLSSSKIEQREVKNKVATFDVNVDGGAEALASAIEGKKAGKYTVEVLEVARGKVVLVLK
ncbi:MAG: hypothetical protein IT383_18575 [Deltaproteobacteria bacterium]|nr:hypothetical protein [Deltaproteobacteria bacterium]